MSIAVSAPGDSVLSMERKLTQLADGVYATTRIAATGEFGNDAFVVKTLVLRHSRQRTCIHATAAEKISVFDMKEWNWPH
jgi:hypothetical protein